MKEYVLMNRETGLTALGVKLLMFDGPDDRILEPSTLGKIAWLPKNPDYWGISTAEGTGFLVMPFAMVDEKIEVIAEI